MHSVKIIHFRCFTPVRRPSYRWHMGLSSLKVLYWAPKDASFLQSSAYRPFKVIQGRKRVWYFLLVRHSNQGNKIFWYAASFWLKIANFSYPTLMRCPSSDVLFGTSWWSLPRRNYSHGAILQWRPHDHVWVILIQHQRVTDRQTDGVMDGFTIAHTASCWRAVKSITYVTTLVQSNSLFITL